MSGCNCNQNRNDLETVIVLILAMSTFMLLPYVSSTTRSSIHLLEEKFGTLPAKEASK